LFLLIESLLVSEKYKSGSKLPNRRKMMPRRSKPQRKEAPVGVESRIR